MRTAYQDRMRDLLDLGPAQLDAGPLLPQAPVHRAPRHRSSCMCTDCWNAGQRYGEYLEQKALEEL